MKQTLHVNQYQCWVSLGCTKEEQSLQQPINVNVQIQFKHPLIGSISDLLKDAVDYVKICNEIKITSENKSYQLIEHLCYEIHKNLLAILIQHSLEGDLSVEVIKLRAPVPNLQGSVQFVCQSPF